MINLLIKTGYPFVAFRYPYEKEFVNIVQNDREVKSWLPGDMHALSGFLLAPFVEGGATPRLLIRNDLSYNWHPGAGGSGPVPLAGSPAAQAEDSSSRREDYLKKVRAVQQHIATGRLSKVVLTRAEAVHLPEMFDFTAFFTALHKAYPAAFIFLAFLPGHGIWAGATPEKLLEITGRHLETTALAGTLPLKEGKSFPDWSAKERHEQQIVTDYILRVLEDAGFRPDETDGPHTVIAGKMAHLETVFRFAQPRDPATLALLAEALHPTPAICGYPREEALDLIRTTEDYDRQYYTGYLGPWNTPYPSRLYVNLRSMFFLPGRRQALLYAGAGITAASVPEKEWEETCLKMNTLLSVLEKLPNFTR